MWRVRVGGTGTRGMWGPWAQEGTGGIGGRGGRSRAWGAEAPVPARRRRATREPQGGQGGTKQLGELF